jgi:hypothetical protein
MLISYLDSAFDRGIVWVAGLLFNFDDGRWYDAFDVEQWLDAPEGFVPGRDVVILHLEKEQLAKSLAGHGLTAIVHGPDTTKFYLSFKKWEIKLWRGAKPLETAG